MTIMTSIWLCIITILQNNALGGNLEVNDDVIKWKIFPLYWPFVRGFHRSPVNFPHKGQWRGALMFSFICAWTNGWVNNLYAVDFRRHGTHYNVTLMSAMFGSVHVHVASIDFLHKNLFSHTGGPSEAWCKHTCSLRTSWYGKAFLIAGSLWGEPTGHALVLPYKKSVHMRSFEFCLNRWKVVIRSNALVSGD